MTASYEYDEANSNVVGSRLTKKANSLNLGRKYIPKVPSTINKSRFAILPKNTRYKVLRFKTLAILIPRAGKKYTLGIVFTGECNDWAFL